MNSQTFTFNPRFTAPSAEVQQSLFLSRKDAERAGSREMRCPICGFKVTDVPLTQTEVV